MADISSPDLGDDLQVLAVRLWLHYVGPYRALL